PIQNLPLGVFTPAGGSPRGGAAIGDEILDLAAALETGLFAGEAARAAEAAEARELMAERAADVSGDREPEPVVDQEQAALSLLKAQLGAHPVDS
ncbi:MAG TPA: hypothetical protein VE463_19685, partial [Blastococcus sp.]|nr:hypothetical protein [Blastococcus sp.]